MLKDFIKKAYLYLILIPSVKYFKKKKTHLFLLMTSNYGNIGDHAISLNEIKFLKDQNINFKEINEKLISWLDKINKLDVFNNSNILLHGGGYLGTLWKKNNDLALKIIENNKNAKIVLMPNSIYFDKTNLGKQEYLKFKNTIENHENLVIFLRDEISYEAIKKTKCKVKLVPDIVTYGGYHNSQTKNNICLMLLRNDCEKTLNDKDIKNIKNQLKALNIKNFVASDMTKEYNIGKLKRANEVNKKFDEIASSYLVITDRLHGAIFSALTKTPCIVLNSKSHKIIGSKYLPKYFSNVIFNTNLNRIKDDFKKATKNNSYQNNFSINKEFLPLKETINEMVK